MTRAIDARRRRLLAGSAATLALGNTPARLLAALAPTPAQTMGPFYPRRPPLETDNDLVRVSGQGGLAQGAITDLSGRVLDPAGEPVDDAVIEIWQCDANGGYHHVSCGRRAARDPNFQGFGTFTTGTDGVYRFRTIRPVPYPGRAPHIHFRVRAPGEPELVTQLYVAGHPRNAGDWILARAGDAAARRRLIVDFEPVDDPEAQLAARFDIVLARRG